MASRLREDERNEKIIRGLLKLPANKRCVNCQNLGPQYVCTNFWTFVCTNCSGAHRDFNHRVKSISMAKFSTQEVTALQEGGNERAKEIYFKEWDPQRHSVPDSSNIDRLRDFIRHVYTDRRYTGERITDRTPRSKSGQDSREDRRPDSYGNGSRSPRNNDTYERHHGERPDSGLRNDVKSVRYGFASPIRDQSKRRRSPARFEVVDDRCREEKYPTGNVIHFQRYRDRNFRDTLPKSGGEVSRSSKNCFPIQSSVIRPVTDILGDDIRNLHVGDLPKSDGPKVPEKSPQPERTASSNSVKSGEENSVEAKRENLGSLIDFSAEPEPPVAATSQQPVPQQTTTSSPISGDRVSLDLSSQQPAPQAAASTNSLETLLAQLSVPGFPSAGSISALPVTGVDSLLREQLPAMLQHEPSLPTAADSQFANLASTALVANQTISPPLSGAPSNVQADSLGEPNIPGPSTALSEQSVQVVSVPPDSSAEILLQTPRGARPSGRQELPEDLFTASYPPAPFAGLGWQGHAGMGYGMPYPSGVAMPTSSHSSRSTNPFDLVNEISLSQVKVPSMACLQGALPSSTLSSLQTSSFEAPNPQWEPPTQPSYLQTGSPSSCIPREGPTDIFQHAPSNILPTAYQGFGGNGSEVLVAFGNSGLDLHSAVRYSQTGTANSFAPMGGNPFG